MELFQLTFRSELGDPLATKKRLGNDYVSFWLVSLNQWKRSYQLDWISILCLATDFAYLQFRFSLHMRTGCLKLLSHLNFFDSNLQFKIELEDSGKLPFLDILIIKNTFSVEFSIYRKPIHNDWYLHFSSNHPPCV